MSPWVVLAWKLGAMEPRRNRGCSAGVAMKRRKMGDGLAKGLREVMRRALRTKETDIVRDIAMIRVVWKGKEKWTVMLSLPVQTFLL